MIMLAIFSADCRCGEPLRVSHRLKPLETAGARLGGSAGIAGSRRGRRTRSGAAGQRRVWVVWWC